MKTIHIPFVEQPELLTYETMNDLLEKEGNQGEIAHAQWNEFPYKPDVKFKIAYTRNYLWIKYNVKGLGLKAEYGKLNEPVFKDSCVEAFFADHDGKGYRNIEVNCIGNLLSSHQEKKGVNKKSITGEEAAKIIRFSSVSSFDTFPEIEGIHEWSIILGVPFSLLGYKEIPETIRGNFYKCADDSKWPHFLSWSAIETEQPDFHRPEFFGTMVFDKKV